MMPVCLFPLLSSPSLFLTVFVYPSLTLFLSLAIPLVPPSCLVRQLCSLYCPPPLQNPISSSLSISPSLPPKPSPRSSLSFPLKSVTYLQHSCLMNNGGETVTISVSIRRICFDLGCLPQPRLPFTLRLPAQLYSHLLSFFFLRNLQFLMFQSKINKTEKDRSGR